FVSSEVLPHVGQWWDDGIFPNDFPKKCGELGLLGMTLSPDQGGAGASYTAYGLVNQEVEYGDSGLRSFTSVQSSLVLDPIARYATEAIKKRWLTPLIQGEAVGCFSLTEPHGGSDPVNMKVTAKRVGNDYVLSGHKRWATNAVIADVAVVWAMNEETGKVAGFVIPTDTAGMEVIGINNKASMRVSVSAEIKLHDVVVPASSKLEVDGLRGPLSCLNGARFGISFGVVGAGQACFDEARGYVADRYIFGEPLAAKQLVQAQLADMLADLTKAGLLAYHLGRLKDDGKATPAHISLGKRDNTRTAVSVSRAARDMLGGNGILTDYAAMRHMTNLESVSTYEGTDSVHTLLLGREITGINAF
ncbi:MAG: acyl-CoA dehydrogenase family protein, partial [Deinococcota bacterium]